MRMLVVLVAIGIVTIIILVLWILSHVNRSRRHHHSLLVVVLLNSGRKSVICHSIGILAMNIWVAVNMLQSMHYLFLLTVIAALLVRFQPFGVIPRVSLGGIIRRRAIALLLLLLLLLALVDIARLHFM
jgi:hypothetical protein